MSETRTVLVPEYLQYFQCIGGECPDTCCAGWRVDIDKETYGKYQRVVDQDWKKFFRTSVQRNRDKPNPTKYASIALQGSVCPALDENKLCRIHSGFGHDYLSNTCAIYPRISQTFSDQIVRAATMSCPEIARIALSNKEPMKQVAIEESVRERMTHTPIHTTPTFYTIRNFAIWLLQNRHYTLSERVVLLGSVCEAIQKQVESVDAIEEIIRFHYELLSSPQKIAFEFPEMQDKQERIHVQFQILQHIIGTRVIQGISSARYVESFKQCLQGIQYGTDLTIVADAYQEAYGTYYEPFFKEREHMLENYLVNYLLKTAFPQGYATLFDTYMMLALHYSLIKMHLIGLSGYHKEEMNEEIVLKLIQSFAKTVEHNQTYLNSILEMLHKDNNANMTCMAVLLTN